ncbi:hypothetical protein BDR06DRAFT_1014861 [Suillus hirtellus]|nr:hypothetical protein BDR06DRAFT_1014861 [Suillus hirtellus]
MNVKNRPFLASVEVPPLASMPWYGVVQQQTQTLESSLELDVGEGETNSMDEDYDSQSSQDLEYSSPPRKKFRASTTRGYQIITFRASEPLQPQQSPLSTHPSSKNVCTELSHVDASLPCPSVPTSTCKTLYKLSMTFGPHGFTCWKCHQLVSPKGLLAHIKRKAHKEIQPKDSQAAITHILQSHKIPEGLHYFSHPTELPNAIPGLIPTLAYKCPQCPRWIRSADLPTPKGKCRHAVAHFKEEHGDLTMPDVSEFKGRYIMRPYCEGNTEEGGRARISNLVIVLPENWMPSGVETSRPANARVNRHNVTAAPQESFLLKIGWPQYVRGLGVVHMRYLMELVEIPSQHRVKELMDANPKRAALENGLLVLDGLHVGYLKDANEFLKSCHPSIRKAVTSGSRANYRLIKDKTYTRYRTPIAKTVFMVLREYHISKLKDKLPQERLGSFRVILSKHQRQATKALHGYIMEEELNHDRLLELLHDLLASLVRHKIHGSGKMECPTDQSLCLLSLREDDRFQLANPLTADCAGLQFAFFSIIIHFARLEAKSSSAFRPFEAKSWSSAHDGIPSTTSSLDLQMHGQEAKCDQIMLSDELEDDDTDSETSDTEYGDEEARSVHRIIEREKAAFLTPLPRPDYFTPFDRMKNIWFECRPTAFKESRDFGFIFSADGQSVTVADGDNHRHQLSITDIGREAQKVLQKLEQCIEESLPDEVHHLFHSFHSIASSFCDDLNDSHSVFLQRPNASRLEPIILSVKDGLCKSLWTDPIWTVEDSGTKVLNESAARGWLKFNDEIISLITTAFALTCGIPPRGFQFHTMQYNHCQTSGNLRSLFIIEGLPALGNPAAKQSNKSIQECLWLFPPSLASPFLFYFGVLRPIVIEILLDLQEDISYQETHIFMHTFPKQRRQDDLPHFWSGPDINQALQSHTKALPIRLTCNLLRHLHTAFFRQFFPGLCDPGHDDSLVDLQGQHHWYTGDRHYGKIIGSIPSTLGMSMTEARRYASISQLLQVLYQLSPPDESWCDLLSSTHILPTLKHETLAYSVAQKLVIQEYGILVLGNATASSQSVTGVLQNAPYFHLPTRAGEAIGDGVLIQVLHTLLFGGGIPEKFSRPPPGGYSVVDVATAITLIIHALEEWSTGIHKPIIRSVDMKATEHFNNVRQSAINILEKVRNQWEKEWFILSEVVHTHRVQPQCRAWHVRGLPLVELD